MEYGASCPVDHVKISETRVRLTALCVFLISSIYLLTASRLAAIFLFGDFLLRAFGWGAYSPLNVLSGFVEKQFSLPTRKVDRAPKLFAAQIGFFFSGALAIAAWWPFALIASLLAGTLLLFSFLEAAFGFCAGCYAYSFIKSTSRRG